MNPPRSGTNNSRRTTRFLARLAVRRSKTRHTLRRNLVHFQFVTKAGAFSGQQNVANFPSGKAAEPFLISDGLYRPPKTSLAEFYRPFLGYNVLGHTSSCTSLVWRFFPHLSKPALSTGSTRSPAPAEAKAAGEWSGPGSSTIPCWGHWQARYARFFHSANGEDALSLASALFPCPFLWAGRDSGSRFPDGRIRPANDLPAGSPRKVPPATLFPKDRASV